MAPAVQVRLDPEGLVTSYPGPALHVNVAGDVLRANADALPLIARLIENRDEALAGAVREAVENGHTIKRRVQAVVEDEWHSFELILLPTSDQATGQGEALILGRDATLERNFTAALVASRQLFKDLVACSTDFAWETDAEGTFTFISPAGALGHAAEDLVGRDYRELVDTEDGADVELPFACWQPQSDVELRLRRVDGKMATVQISSLPVRTREGIWRGARGVCRDVTQLRRQEAALQRARRRETLMREVVDAIRTEVVPETMFQAAVAAIAKVMDTAQCWIVRRREDDTLAIAAAHDHGAQPAVGDESLLAALPGLAGDGAAARFADLDGGHRSLIAACDYRGGRLGYLCLTRPSDEPAWSDEDQALALGVADQLGIAMAQAAVQEELALLSRTDDLTGLMNRRALEAELAVRLHNLERLGLCGCLMYLDLDNFKAVNDTHGHHVGDAVLREFAGLLGVSVRKGDLAARVGGDEFVVWLEGAKAEGAFAKGKSLLRAAACLDRFSTDPSRPLSVSIGVAAVTSEDDLDLRALMCRVDEAMYRAKREGRNRVTLARRVAAVEYGEATC
jgi:diguanylate cyclase (GGDEF)-like protein/PAS domain S-box-containing protein